jgi:hypothetical protein
MNAATTVFSIAELLELILLALPSVSTSQELLAIRTILLGRTTTRAWHLLLSRSTRLRQRLYRATPAGLRAAHKDWAVPQCCPPARPNPWIPPLLLQQRGWGALYPFDDVYDRYGVAAAAPRHWTFSVEFSAAQYRRRRRVDDAARGSWRDMLAAQPPFLRFWYTRCVYELGSGRAPFVTYVDYEPGRPKSRQRYCVHCAGGVTLGAIWDAVTRLFEEDPGAQFVMVESLCPTEDGEDGGGGDVDSVVELGSDCSAAPGVVVARNG